MNISVERAPVVVPLLIADPRFRKGEGISVGVGCRTAQGFLNDGASCGGHTPGVIGSDRADVHSDADLEGVCVDFFGNCQNGWQVGRFALRQCSDPASGESRKAQGRCIATPQRGILKRLQTGD